MKEKYKELAKKLNLIDDDKVGGCVRPECVGYETHIKLQLQEEIDEKSRDITFLVRRLRLEYEEYKDEHERHFKTTEAYRNVCKDIDAIYDEKQLLERIIDKMLEQQTNKKGNE